MIKNLTQHGNSKAIIIDKALLLAAGLDENSIFQITINPNGGIIIQSVPEVKKPDAHKKNVDATLKKHKKLFERLADRSTTPP